jgi:UDP-3-O-[3-hydroxymyristoyl] glucosamine N-acyltransferase
MEWNKIGAGSYVGPNVKLEKMQLYPNVTILDECTIGKNCTMVWNCGALSHWYNCIIHPNAVIGADGFGFRPCPERGLSKYLR